LTGQIKYKDKPLGGGTITFYHPEGGVYPFPIDPEGTYAASDLPIGNLTVTIETETARTAHPTEYADGRGHKMQLSPKPEEAKKQAGVEGSYVKIPPKYAGETTSGLSVTLAGGRNTHNFDLE
jgi:hypothetical protein